MLCALTLLGYSIVFLRMTGLFQDYLTWMSQDSWTPQWKASTVFTLSFFQASSVNPYLAVSTDVTFNQLPILNKLWCHLLYPKTLPKVSWPGCVSVEVYFCYQKVLLAMLWKPAFDKSLCQHRLCPLQYSGLENSTDREAWWATYICFYFYILCMHLLFHFILIALLMTPHHKWKP